jgi:beta-phosphoglucomutase-like phosphatase (HAD superfamily)
MKLVIFDIDGTLTQTSRVDEICYIRAIAETHGIDVAADKWSDCPHVSDSGVTAHLFRSHFGREPREDESQAIKKRLVDLLEQHHRTERSYFDEIPGAAETFNRIVHERYLKSIHTSRVRQSLPIAHFQLPIVGQG